MLKRFMIKLLGSGLMVALLLVVFTEASWTDAVMAAVGLALVSYIIGDHLILRYTTNTYATIAEAGLSMLYLGMIASYFNWSLSFGELMIISLFLALTEFILHSFMKTEPLDIM